MGPWAFVLAAIASFAIFAAVLRKLNNRMVTGILFLATLIPFFGAAMWVVETPRYGILLLVVLGLVVKIQLERDWRHLVATQ
jgi:hypothetical protein